LLHDSWKQSSLEVSFDREGTTLRISISSHAAQFFALENRSDGLRIFIALRAFLGDRSFAVPPILLVDEAEQHLHYDAQADLVRMFEAQDVAAAVIYTTHSIGCLPQDLGRGVRVVTPDVAGGASTVQNIWTRSHRGGVSPLMDAMGAATIPLAPSRFVVIGEGPSEAMLLPSLLREASAIAALEFQVVSGIAESSDPALRRLEIEAARVAYVVDGDDAGWKHAERLKGLGIRAGRVVKLSTKSVGMCLEDLIDPALYARAVNEYLRSWPPHKDGFPETALGRTGRPLALKKWCHDNDVPYPSKVLIAEQVLRLLEVPNPPPGQRIADAKKLETLIRVRTRLLVALGILERDGTPLLADDAA
jgi:predicted ATP-dependent endonuclease of OLD family